jgi:hypothetical protein
LIEEGIMTEGKGQNLVIPTEVYSRVVGYYRPVQNWNTGKQQEFSERNTYDRAFETIKAKRALA